MVLVRKFFFLDLFAAGYVFGWTGVFAMVSSFFWLIDAVFAQHDTDVEIVLTYFLLLVIISVQSATLVIGTEKVKAEQTRENFQNTSTF